MPVFSIILPAYNNSKELELLLASIQKHCLDINKHETIVVDDGSKDNSIESVCRNFVFIKYLRSETNNGVANARNLGARLAKNDILIFIDSDLIAQSDFISILSEKFRNHDVIAVSGTLSSTPANPSLYRDYWGLYKAFHMPKGRYTSLFTGAYGAIRKDVFWKAGGWDANMRGALKEEYEFTARLEKLVAKIHYEPRFEVKVHCNGFWKLVPENYRRAKKWCIIFLYRKKFDDYTSTFSGGMSYVLGTFVVISGIIAFLAPKFILFFICALLLYLTVIFKFLVFIVKKKGLLFTLLSIYFHLVSSLFIFFGAMQGLSYCFLTDAAKRKAINS
ncbi:MAG: glycosyltransferase family 2 protein [Candidatus Omnitrophica bacterium]|nr:glycosyltransferase family 2 protein [Candidatus Omnitrophota bacterium]MDD5591913.1 glycosyltransferase family 2 protein [Candidatus Omnitrophota bacterium]